MEQARAFYQAVQPHHAFDHLTRFGTERFKTPVRVGSQREHQAAQGHTHAQGSNQFRTHSCSVQRPIMSTSSPEPTAKDDG